MIFFVKLTVLLVFTFQSAHAYPVKDYVLAYIPVDELPSLAAMVTDSDLSTQSKLLDGSGRLLDMQWTLINYTPKISCTKPLKEAGFNIENIEIIPAPYYQNPYLSLYDPWSYQRMTYDIPMMIESIYTLNPYIHRSPYPQTRGPVNFGGQVEGRGGVSIRGEFGNDGYQKITSYSTPSTPVVVTPEPTVPDSDWPFDSILPRVTLPKITTLPEVNIPSFIETNKIIDMPLPASGITMPHKPSPIIMALSSMAEKSFIEVRNLGCDSDGESGPVKFGGKVPASGRIRISANF